MKEKISEYKSRFPKRCAKIILSRCSVCNSKENLFGIRIEQVSKIWLKTWAFKLEEEKAKHERWSEEKITSSLNASDSYNGCPYCGGFNFAQCACGKIFCYGNKDSEKKSSIELKCPWCNKIGVYEFTEAVTVQGGGF